MKSKTKSVFLVFERHYGEINVIGAHLTKARAMKQCKETQLRWVCRHALNTPDMGTFLYP